VVLSEPEETADTITVAFFDTVDPGRAPFADNPGERLLVRYLYETLITVDCFDEVQAGLAESWKSGKGGRRWTFTLRDGARFWDGTLVSARHVALSWQDALTLSPGIDSVSVDGDRVVHVYLERPHRRVPRELSASVFAVTLPSEDTPWLIGSGRYRIVGQTEGHTFETGRVITLHPVWDRKEPIVRFVASSLNDARDLLEGGIDVMVTADPTVLAYAANRPEYASEALPWDKTYVLLSTSRVRELRTGGTVGTLPADLLDQIARDAVRGDARGHQPPPWWDTLSDCDLGGPPGYQPPSSGGPEPGAVRRVLYDSSDGIARGLAERIVSLATRDAAVSPEAAAIASAVPGLKGTVSGLIAEGVTDSEFHASLRRGNDFAYVVSILRAPPDPCYEAGELVDDAPWLSHTRIGLSEAMIPLVDVRARVIVRRGRTGLMVDGFGNVLIVPRER
jgi:hypothetical protein